jgi:Heparinase II/III-like protein
MPALRVFHDVGWAAVQAHMDDPARQFQLVFKSSPYGSLSHSHGDQNAFLLRACGEDLAIQSGHYVAFNSQMHQQWRRQTRSKNALLIGSKGQYAGADKARAKAASGRIIEARETPGAIVIVGDATAAYRSENAHVESVRREIHAVGDKRGDRYLVIVDQVALGEAAPLTWLLHSEGALTSGGQTFRLTGKRAGLYGQFVYCTAGQPTVRAVEGFPGIDETEITGLARHRHIAAETPPARRISLVTLLVPYPLSAPRRILHFIDDQGHGVSLYFVDEDGGEYKVGLGDG